MSRIKTLGASRTSACGICGIMDESICFDVDHKIPRCCGGPNEPWNLWPLCLRHHRKKSISENAWIRRLQKNEHKCFSCNEVHSKYFQTNIFWCLRCLELNFEKRKRNLEETIKRSVLLHP